MLLILGFLLLLYFKIRFLWIRSCMSACAIFRPRVPMLLLSISMAVPPKS